MCDVQLCSSLLVHKCFLLSHRETVLLAVTYSFDNFSSCCVCPADDGIEECRGESLEGVCGENECEFVEDSCETVCDDSCESESGASW